MVRPREHPHQAAHYTLADHGVNTGQQPDRPTRNAQRPIHAEGFTATPGTAGTEDEPRIAPIRSAVKNPQSPENYIYV